MIHDRIAPVIRIALAAVAVSSPGCAGKVASLASSEAPATSDASTSSVAAPASSQPSPTPAAKKGVGDACVPEDGWLPPAGPPGITVTILDGGLPQYHPQPLAGPQSVTDLGPGVPYCDYGWPSKNPDNSYFTITCKTDSDCPDGSGCPDNGLGSVGKCRAICLSDADCVPRGGTQWGCGPSRSSRGNMCVYLPWL